MGLRRPSGGCVRACPICLRVVDTPQRRAPCLQSAEIISNVNPVWPAAAITVQKLCNGNYTAPLEFACWDWNKDGEHVLIGSATTTLGDIVRNPAMTLPLINPVKASKRGYTNSGVLSLGGPVILHEPTLLEYVRGGCEVSLIVAV